MTRTKLLHYFGFGGARAPVPPMDPPLPVGSRLCYSIATLYQVNCIYRPYVITVISLCKLSEHVHVRLYVGYIDIHGIPLF